MPRSSCQLDHPREDHSCFVKLFGGPCSASLASLEEGPLFPRLWGGPRDANVWEGIVLFYAPRGWSSLIGPEADLLSYPCRLVTSLYPRVDVPRGVFAFSRKHSSFTTCVAFPVKCIARLTSLMTFASCSLRGSHSRCLALVFYLIYSLCWDTGAIVVRVGMLSSV